MQLSEAGLTRLKELEGFRGDPYDDGEGYRTVGYGHRLHDGDAALTLPLTEESAAALLRQDVALFERAVTRLVKVAVTQGQFDALVLFTYNVGISAFEHSSVLAYLNEGKYAAVPQLLLRWHFAHGQSVPGLVKRRLSEAALWQGV